MSHRSSTLARRAPSRAASRDVALLVLGLVLVATGLLLLTFAPAGGSCGGGQAQGVDPIVSPATPHSDDTARKGGQQ